MLFYLSFLSQLYSDLQKLRIFTMPTIKAHTKLILIECLMSSIFTLGCSDSSSKPAASTPAITLSKELTQIYIRSCKNCHITPGTGAPLTGDHESWNKILQQGIDTVVDKAMSGVGGMPPAGQCFECSPEQIKELILYMANPAK